MPQPAVSILLPVYNSEKYLRRAIDSLVNQTFTDFELLILNDGSSDRSEQIIQSYIDSRIVYVKNEVNKGLIYSLNKGIALAKGEFVARMDGDDICLPERLQKQYDWLEKSASTAVVGCHVSFIDDSESITGEWKEDVETKSHSQIKKKMCWENCMAHSSVMVRAEILKQYRYKENQKDTEDYDLWLRILADNQVIEKVPEKLLLYRVHESSITGSILRKSNPFFKLFHCKRRFLQSRFSEGKWGMFETKVLLTTISNVIMGIGKNVKSIIKR